MAITTPLRIEVTLPVSDPAARLEPTTSAYVWDPDEWQVTRVVWRASISTGLHTDVADGVIVAVTAFTGAQAHSNRSWYLTPETVHPDLRHLVRDLGELTPLQQPARARAAGDLADPRGEEKGQVLVVEFPHGSSSCSPGVRRPAPGRPRWSSPSVRSPGHRVGGAERARGSCRGRAS